jgi:hypothetical protein
MKKNLLLSSLMLFFTIICQVTSAQHQLVADQNPAYEQSRSRYITMADSLNAWHSTTFQDTYKAIDYLADKQEARELRRAFRRELRLERARNGYGWYDDYSDYPAYGNSYGHYGSSNWYPAYGNGIYGRGYLNYNRSNYRRNYRNNYIYNSVPLAFALAWYLR